MSSATIRAPRLPSRSGGPQQSARLFALWQQERDPHAREELLREFMPLARKLAARYRSPNESLEDLFQVAALGLLGAIDRFDPGRGPSFTAFAVPTIFGELKRHFRNTGWAAHVPRGAQEMALRINEVVQALTTSTGRSPSVSAIAEYLEVSVEDVLLGLEASAAHYSISLDAPTSTTSIEEPQPMAETLGFDDDGLELVEARLSLSAAIRDLPHLERQAVRLRIENDSKQSEIARQMGCSQMQVSRLLRRAAVHLRAQTDPELNP
jgi:RNA polymerase sigma-B factor